MPGHKKLYLFRSGGDETICHHVAITVFFIQKHLLLLDLQQPLFSGSPRALSVVRLTLAIDVRFACVGRNIIQHHERGEAGKETFFECGDEGGLLSKRVSKGAKFAIDLGVELVRVESVGKQLRGVKRSYPPSWECS